MQTRRNHSLFDLLFVSMHRYICAVLFWQCFVETLQSNTNNPANTTQLTWREILPKECGYGDSALDEEFVEFETEDPSDGGNGNKFTNGHFSTIESYPWQVAILSSDEKAFKFGGTIISKYHVLTAAHCFMMETNKTINNAKHQAASPVSHTTLLVAVGSSRYAESDAVYKIKELYIHNSYSYSHSRNDIALLKIDGEFVWSIFVFPICLPAEDEEYEPGRVCHVSGFGYVKEGTSKELGILRSGSVSLSTENDCKEKKREQQGTITEGIFCASGFTKEDVKYDTCQDDSGGPLQCVGRNGSQSVLLGITSVGKGCGLKNHPGVYTKVSKYLQWIHDRVEGRLQDENGPTTQKPASIEFPTDCAFMKPRMPLSQHMVNVAADAPNFHIEKTPWLVTLRLARNQNNPAFGAIISKKYVLTAAHDIYAPQRTPQSHSPTQFILAGDPTLQGRERKYKIARTILHPEYNASTFSNDIALIEISDEFTFSDEIQPICMPYDELYQINRRDTIPGNPHGKTSSTIGFNQSVHKLVSDGTCSKKYVGHKLSTKMFCSVAESGVDRDLGGPLFASKGGRHYLLGVFSWRWIGADNDFSPRINTKVINYMDWIRLAMTGVKSEN